MYCQFCGEKIPDDSAFCPFCGEKFTTVGQKNNTSNAEFDSEPCVNSTIRPGFSDKINDPVTPVVLPVKEPVVSVSVSDEPPVPGSAAAAVRTKPKKRWKRAVALLLVAALVLSGVRYLKRRKDSDTDEDSALGGSGIISEEDDAYSVTMNTTPEFTGLTDIVFDTEAAISTEDIMVGGESTDYTLSSGVSVSFDPYSVSDSEHTLTVSELGEKNDGKYQCVAYDFLLDGEEANLAGVTCLRLPYDPSWGENVFVQYYNEESGNWEILYTETDGNGNAVCYTDHFCTFAVFKNMVLDVLEKPAAESGKVFHVYGDDPLNKQVYVDYAALAAYLREQSTSTIQETSGQSTEYFVEKGLDTIGFYSSAMETGTKGAEAAALAGGLDKVAGFAGSTSNMLGHFGAVVTVSKLMTNVYRRDGNVDYYEVLKDNKNEIASLALYAGSLLGAGSVAAFCNAAGILLFVYTTTDAAITSISLEGSGTPEDYAYRKFTTKYIVYNTKTGICSTRYVANAWEDASAYYEADTIPLPSCEACKYADWKSFFDSIGTLEPREIPAWIDNVLTQYTSIFWNLPQTDPNTLERFLSNTRAGGLTLDTLEEEYKRPSNQKIKEYKAALKSDLYKWLRPYMQECLRKSYFAMLNDAYREAAELEAQFNSQICFSLEDPSVESFSESSYAQYRNTLSGTQSGDIRYESAESGLAERWLFSRENGYCVICTYLSYLLSGTPEYLRVQNGDTDVLSLEITPAYPKTVIYFGEAPEPEEITDELLDDSAWRLTEILYGDKYENSDYKSDYSISGTSFSMSNKDYYIRGTVPYWINEAQDLELDLEAQGNWWQVGIATKECPDVLTFTTGQGNDQIKESGTAHGSQYFDQIMSSNGNYIFLNIGSEFVFVYEKASTWDQSEPEPTVTHSTYPVSDAWDKYRDLM